ncbi:hypothetical protein [Morganella psychrotolerans]|uniref:Uncharacterized protein n=1 Tax=Morganella psychrotolerans TaxID=368603 RepID=A0A1B8HTW6_9GAMM|nr:hypothetical protein [Morganella psychrotolerans]OBU13323.1 hypothetical protein AYY18_00820 [Morganella psychrotolerans]
MQVFTTDLSGKDLLAATAKALNISEDALKSDISRQVLSVIQGNRIMTAFDGKQWMAFNPSNDHNPAKHSSDYIDCYRSDADALGSTIWEVVFRAVCVGVFGKTYEVTSESNSRT